MRSVPRLRFRLAALLLLLLAPPLLANAGEGRQGHGKRHHDPEKRLAHMTEELDLTSTQQEELRPILEAQSASFRALREQKQSGASREELRGAFRAQRDSNAAEVEAVLDEKQVTTYRELRKNREQRMRERHDRRRERDAGTGPPDDAI